MTPEAMAALVDTADALYQARLARLRTVLAEEGRLRRELADLDGHRLRNAALPAPDMAGLRAVGAEVLWQGWVGRMRADLNARLARVLAQKEAQMDALREAFGRAEAARGLLEDARVAARKQAATRAARQVENLVQMRAFRRGQMS